MKIRDHRAKYEAEEEVCGPNVPMQEPDIKKTVGEKGLEGNLDLAQIRILQGTCRSTGSEEGLQLFNHYNAPKKLIVKQLKIS